MKNGWTETNQVFTVFPMPGPIHLILRALPPAAAFCLVTLALWRSWPAFLSYESYMYDFTYRGLAPFSEFLPFPFANLSSRDIPNLELTHPHHALSPLLGNLVHLFHSGSQIPLWRAFNLILFLLILLGLLRRAISSGGVHQSPVEPVTSTPARTAGAIADGFQARRVYRVLTVTAIFLLPPFFFQLGSAEPGLTALLFLFVPIAFPALGKFTGGSRFWARPLLFGFVAGLWHVIALPVGLILKLGLSTPRHAENSSSKIRLLFSRFPGMLSGQGYRSARLVRFQRGFTLFSFLVLLYAILVAAGGYVSGAWSPADSGRNASDSPVVRNPVDYLLLYPTLNRRETGPSPRPEDLANIWLGQVDTYPRYLRWNRQNHPWRYPLWKFSRNILLVAWPLFLLAILARDVYRRRHRTLWLLLIGLGLFLFYYNPHSRDYLAFLLPGLLPPLWRAADGRTPAAIIRASGIIIFLLTILFHFLSPYYAQSDAAEVPLSDWPNPSSVPVFSASQMGITQSPRNNNDLFCPNTDQPPARDKLVIYSEQEHIRLAHQFIDFFLLDSRAPALACLPEKDIRVKIRELAFVQELVTPDESDRELTDLGREFLGEGLHRLGHHIRRLRRDSARTLERLDKRESPYMVFLRYQAPRDWTLFFDDLDPNRPRAPVMSLGEAILARAWERGARIHLLRANHFLPPENEPLTYYKLTPRDFSRGVFRPDRFASIFLIRPSGSGMEENK